MRNLIFLGSIELSENRTHHAAIIERGNATSFSQVILTNRKRERRRIWKEYVEEKTIAYTYKLHSALLKPVA